MNHCKKCQNILEENMAFCPYCGQSVENEKYDNHVDITTWLVIGWFFTSPLSILCAYMLGKVNKAASKEKAQKVYIQAKIVCILNALITTPLYGYLIYILLKFFSLNATPLYK